MLLVEFLEVADENRNMVVFDEDRVVSVYDGRDSIDETLNNRIVATVDCRNNEFHVFLKQRTYWQHKSATFFLL